MFLARTLRSTNPFDAVTILETGHLVSNPYFGLKQLVEPPIDRFEGWQQLFRLAGPVH